MKYQIFREQHIDLLEDAVNDAIGQGWEPIGGIAVVVTQDAVYCYQALIKRDTEEDARR